MENDKYVNYYIETLVSTMNDAIVRNISLQANLRIYEEAIGELQKKLEEHESKKSHEQQSVNKTIQDLEGRISQLTTELSTLYSMKNDYENTKHQIQHIDTFRNELVRSREENERLKNEYESKIKELNETINYLQLSPAKRKKIDDANKPKEESVVVENNLLEQITKDGGTF